jgi:ribosomal protein S18 acetylase RimI-like enzyme
MAALLRRRPSVSRLSAADLPAIGRFLDTDPVTNVYLRSELRLGARTDGWWGVGTDASLRAVVAAGPLTVPSIPDPDDAPLLAQAVLHEGPPRLMIGPAPQIRALRAAMPLPQAPAEVRDPQPFLILARTPDGTSSPPVRRADIADLDRLVVAAAAMHREEMGVDPLNIDAVGWRSRMACLVERGWAYVWMERGEVLFKLELSAWTPEAVQLQGVWTAPRHRRRGLATAGLAAVCAELLGAVPLCTLYVNAYNEPALRLYRRLGFRQAGDFATVIYP